MRIFRSVFQNADKKQIITRLRNCTSVTKLVNFVFFFVEYLHEDGRKGMEHGGLLHDCILLCLLCICGDKNFKIVKKNIDI